MHYVDPSLDLMFEKYDKNQFAGAEGRAEMERQSLWRSDQNPDEGLF